MSDPKKLTAAKRNDFAKASAENNAAVVAEIKTHIDNVSELYAEMTSVTVADAALVEGMRQVTANLKANFDHFVQKALDE